MVRVNTKPQYLVFWCHLWNPSSKQRQSSVESSKGPCGERVRGLESASFSVQPPGGSGFWPALFSAAGPLRPLFQQRRPARRGEQGARTVQLPVDGCANCGKGDRGQGSGVRDQLTVHSGQLPFEQQGAYFVDLWVEELGMDPGGQILEVLRGRIHRRPGV
jgi:hypothetical protein